MSYVIDQVNFKGPIDLLLEMVRKKDVDIYEIKISSIVEGFISHIKENKITDLDILTGFLYVTATLLEIKSKFIMPSINKDESEKEKTVDENILILRQNEYKKYKKISNYFKQLIVEENNYYVREAPVEKEYIDALPNFLKDLNVTDLNRLASLLLKREEFKVDVKFFEDEIKINIFDEMERIKYLLESSDKITFKELSDNYRTTIEVIITFLSILELYKNEVLEIMQFESFGEIIISRTGEQ